MSEQPILGTKPPDTSTMEQGVQAEPYPLQHQYVDPLPIEKWAAPEPDDRITDLPGLEQDPINNPVHKAEDREESAKTGRSLQSIVGEKFDAFTERRREFRETINTLREGREGAEADQSNGYDWAVFRLFHSYPDLTNEQLTRDREEAKEGKGSPDSLLAMMSRPEFLKSAAGPVGKLMGESVYRPYFSYAEHQNVLAVYEAAGLSTAAAEKLLDSIRTCQPSSHLSAEDAVKRRAHRTQKSLEHLAEIRQYDPRIPDFLYKRAGIVGFDRYKPELLLRQWTVHTQPETVAGRDLQLVITAHDDNNAALTYGTPEHLDVDSDKATTVFMEASSLVEVAKALIRGRKLAGKALRRVTVAAHGGADTLWLDDNNPISRQQLHHSDSLRRLHKKRKAHGGERSNVR